jgi:hypothetical protein
VCNYRRKIQTISVGYPIAVISFVEENFVGVLLILLGHRKAFLERRNIGVF